MHVPANELQLSNLTGWYILVLIPNQRKLTLLHSGTEKGKSVYLKHGQIGQKGVNPSRVHVCRTGNSWVNSGHLEVKTHSKHHLIGRTTD